MLTLTLPFGPTANRHWRYVNGRVLLSAEGRRYRTTVAECVLEQCGKMLQVCEGRLSVEIDLRPPDRRRWDLDGRIKPCLDALVSAGVLIDDERIDRLLVVRKPPGKPGLAVVRIEVLEEMEDGV